ncbi:chloride channel protein 3 [Pseudozyma hubeiensis SY62]|uniref:Chloride channel protein 3 n=1 Tax=Pseudozyma hubeiensis (strain SY62) TaxID=1305764 RepID=R9NYZ7_PSEHS|nr:chloride channel protein 3 [Pseudozyma hubeiensis SY62]GAC93877.1 chloride channel protein 3 [Pseudozyma hubeiensis SY62]
MPPSRSPSLSAPPINLRHPLPAPPIQCIPPASASSSRVPNRHSKPSSSSASSSSSTSYKTSHHRHQPSPSPSPYYSSSSHPSPASCGSASSSASSLRTPPDLLVNGSSVGHVAGGAKGGSLLEVNTWNGMLVKPRAPKMLSREEILRRQTLLISLPADSSWQLPSPPSSPKRKRPSSLAVRYRDAARHLKHLSDTHPIPCLLSACQQLDSVLLFCQSFWLDDAECGRCIAKNWSSLFGLLRYTSNAVKGLAGKDVLLAVCRLVEAAVLRKLHRHDSELLLSKVQDKAIEMQEVGGMLKRQMEDLERSDRLAVQASDLLTKRLRSDCPRLWKRITEQDEIQARQIDVGREEGCVVKAWPTLSSGMPELVAFGRLAVAETARRDGLVEFQLVEVREEE